jgi:hypothetical protein
VVIKHPGQWASLRQQHSNNKRTLSRLIYKGFVRYMPLATLKYLPRIGKENEKSNRVAKARGISLAFGGV